MPTSSQVLESGGPDPSEMSVETAELYYLFVQLGLNPKYFPLLPLIMPELGSIRYSAELASLQLKEKTAILHSLLCDIINKLCDRRANIVILLEDVQWQDPSGWRMTRLVQYNCPHALLILVTRPVEEFTDTSIAAVYQSIKSGAGTVTVHVGELTQNDLRELITASYKKNHPAAYPGSVDESLVTSIAAASEFNAFVAEILIETHLQNHEIDLKANKLGLVKGRNVRPKDKMVSFGAKGVLSLSNKTNLNFQRILPLAAVVGQHVDFALLPPLLASVESSFATMTVSELHAFVRKHDTCSFLVDSDDGEHRMYFRHKMIHLTFYNLLTPSERSQHHFKLYEILNLHKADTGHAYVQFLTTAIFHIELTRLHQHILFTLYCDLISVFSDLGAIDEVESALAKLTELLPGQPARWTELVKRENDTGDICFVLSLGKNTLHHYTHALNLCRVDPHGSSRAAKLVYIYQQYRLAQSFYESNVLKGHSSVMVYSPRLLELRSAVLQKNQECHGELSRAASMTMAALLTANISGILLESACNALHAINTLAVAANEAPWPFCTIMAFLATTMNALGKRSAAKRYIQFAEAHLTAHSRILVEESAQHFAYHAAQCCYYFGANEYSKSWESLAYHRSYLSTLGERKPQYWEVTGMTTVASILKVTMGDMRAAQELQRYFMTLVTAMDTPDSKTLYGPLIGSIWTESKVAAWEEVQEQWKMFQMRFGEGWDAQLPQYNVCASLMSYRVHCYLKDTESSNQNTFFSYLKTFIKLQSQGSPAKPYIAGSMTVDVLFSWTILLLDTLHRPHAPHAKMMRALCQKGLTTMRKSVNPMGDVLEEACMTLAKGAELLSRKPLAVVYAAVKTIWESALQSRCIVNGCGLLDLNVRVLLVIIGFLFEKTIPQESMDIKGQLETAHYKAATEILEHFLG